MAGSNGYTPTQRRILDALADGLPHPYADVYACLSDELAGPTAVSFHLTGLRKKLQPQGEGIATHRLNGTSYYQHVRLLGSPYRG